MEGICNKKHIFILLLLFLCFNQFFNIFILDIHVWRILNWGTTTCLAIYVLKDFHKVPSCLKKRWNFILCFLGIVLLSFVYVTLITRQTLDETYRVSISWFQYLLIFFLYQKKYTTKELFVSLKIFSFIWFAAWFIGFLSPIPLYDASGEYDAQQLMSTGRGVVRLKVAGQDLMNLWGLWCLGIYVANRKNKYLLGYLACLLFVVLCVSRQHILYYSLVGFFFLFYKFSLWKKLILFLAIYVTIVHVLPQTTIYQNLVELTSSQMEANDGGKDDIRILAATYFITEYPQDLYSIFLGHGAYHSNSDYGRLLYSIIDNKGFVLADVGFVGIFFYYGLLGLCCMFCLLKHVWRTKVPIEFMGLKLFVYFMFMGNVFSHNIDQSTISTSICLYVLYLAEQSRRTKLIL